MFIYSAKLDKKKIAAILICIAVVVLVLVFVFARGGNESPPTADKVKKEQIELLQSSKLESNEERLYLLTSLGWEVDMQPAEAAEVRIPSEFSEVYEKYNLIQKEQGLNLEKYKGDKVMRYTYVIVNHPSGETILHATLLVKNNKLIGGDISSPKLNGFMHSLLMPSDVQTSLTPDATTVPGATTVPDASAGAIVTSEVEPTVGGDEDAFPTD